MVNTTIITDEESRKVIELPYSIPLEQLIKHKAEECEILSKLHLMSHKKYKTVETYFNIPIITITAVIGFVSALNIEFTYINIVIGIASLFVSLLKSYSSYLQISQKNENHRVAYLQYYQISNEIRIELSLSRDIRQPANYLLNLIKIKMKNLNEVSQLIDNQIIESYVNSNRKNELFGTIGKPDILNDITPIDICIWNNNDEEKNSNDIELQQKMKPDEIIEV
jgi:hypothetical protein